MNEIDILKWAAGAPLDLPRFDGLDDDRILYLLGIDEEKVYSLLQRHKLIQRFLGRYQKERPGWCSKTLLGNLLQQSFLERQHLDRQIAAMQEVMKVTASHAYPPILIKGFTTYALTGDDSHWHGSVDLDVFHCDPDYLLETLPQIGFTPCKHTLAWDEFGTLTCENVPETAPLVNGEHEFGHLLKGDVKIEVHRYFPACSYPKGVRDVNLTPALHPGCWRQTFGDLSGKGVLYKDLWQQRMHGTTPETQAMVVPDPAMAAFVRCLHLFLHYMRVIDILSADKDVLALKLNDLAEIRDLAQHAQFDKARFLHLTTAFGGQDAVDLASSLLHAYFRSEMLRFASRSSLLQQPFRFPQCLILWRCWASYSTAEELLLPADLDAVIERLGPNVIPAAPPGAKQSYAVFAEGCGQPIERVLLHALHDEEIPVRFGVTYAAGEIVFDVTFLKPLCDDARFYRLDILGRCTPNGHSMSAIAQENPASSVEGQASSPQRDHYTSRHAFPWSDPSQPAFVLLLIGLQHKEKPAWFAFDPLIAVPLKITF